MSNEQEDGTSDGDEQGSRRHRAREWDVRRLGASFVVACRDKGLKDAIGRDIVMTCVRRYRESIAEFSEMKTLELFRRDEAKASRTSGAK